MKHLSVFKSQKPHSPHRKLTVWSALLHRYVTVQKDGAKKKKLFFISHETLDESAIASGPWTCEPVKSFVTYKSPLADCVTGIRARPPYANKVCSQRGCRGAAPRVKKNPRLWCSTPGFFANADMSPLITCPRLPFSLCTGKIHVNYSERFLSFFSRSFAWRCALLHAAGGSLLHV